MPIRATNVSLGFFVEQHSHTTQVFHRRCKGRVAGLATMASMLKRHVVELQARLNSCPHHVLSEYSRD